MNIKHFYFLLFTLVAGFITACSSEDEVNVECPPNVMIDNVTGKTVCLLDEAIELKANLEKNPLGATFEWTVNEQNAGSGEAFTFSSSTAGIFTIGLTASNRDGVDSDAITIQVNGNNPPVITGITGNTTCFPGETISLTAALEESALATQYSWTRNGQILSTEKTCTFSSETTGTFTLTFTATNSDGVDIETVTVNVVNKFSIDDIQNWTGEGNNTSILGIQWTTGSSINAPTDADIKYYAWGYRWNPATPQTGYDMIAAVAKNDPRLFVVAGSSAMGKVIYGLGYDGNNDGKFEIQNTDGTFKRNQGHFVDGIYEPQAGESLDNLKSTSQYDLWMGGWEAAYATYWTGSDGTNVPSDFGYSPISVSGRSLTNQSWDTWTFSSFNDNMQNVNPRPALIQAAPAKADK